VKDANIRRHGLNDKKRMALAEMFALRPTP